MRPPFLRIWQRHAELLIAFPVSLALEFSIFRVWRLGSHTEI